jgi:hypothetical protein
MMNLLKELVEAVKPILADVAITNQDDTCVGLHLTAAEYASLKLIAEQVQTYLDLNHAIWQMKTDLRENRIKDGVDYAVIHKYDETHVVCPAVWQDAIKEAARRHGVTISHWYFTAGSYAGE